MAKPNKYRAKKCTIDGYKFDSLKEGRRYRELVLMQRAEQISHLKLQPQFEINVSGQKICKYIADFEYIEKGEMVIEDVKGVRTPAFNLKFKLMKAVHGIEIKIT